MIVYALPLLLVFFAMERVGLLDAGETRATATGPLNIWEQVLEHLERKIARRGIRWSFSTVFLSEENGVIRVRVTDPVFAEALAMHRDALKAALTEVNCAGATVLLVSGENFCLKLV